MSLSTLTTLSRHWNIHVCTCKIFYVNETLTTKIIYVTTNIAWKYLFCLFCFKVMSSALKEYKVIWWNFFLAAITWVYKSFNVENPLKLLTQTFSFFVFQNDANNHDLIEMLDWNFQHLLILMQGIQIWFSFAHKPIEKISKKKQKKNTNSGKFYCT